MKKLLIVVLAAALVVPAAGEDAFAKMCAEAAENEGVEYICLDGTMLKLARMVMDSQTKNLMKSLKVSSMDLLTIKGGNDAVRSSVLEKAHALLGGEEYEKAPASKSGGEVYLERGSGGESFTAMVVIMDSAGESVLYRMKCDLRPETLEGLTL